jgi:hypothetical protein
VNAYRKAQLRRHLGDAFVRAHGSQVRRVSRRVVVLAVAAFCAYLGLLVEAARSTADAPGIMVRR